MHDQWTNSRRARALFGLVAVSVLAAAACGDDSDSGSGGTVPVAGTAAEGGTTPGSAGGTAAAGGMSITIDEPSDGAEVSGEFTVSMTPSVEVGEPETGLHHIHLYYDGDTDEGDYDIVYSDSTTVTRPLDPGEHTIEAVIANADHSLTDASTEITVNVTESGGAGGTGDTTPAPDYTY
jgi:hypothetical protein